MADTLTRLERAPTWRPRGLCVAMFCAPGLLALAARGWADSVTPEAVDVGGFVPSSLVWRLFMMTGVVYAVVFMLLMNRLRTPGAGTFDKTTRRGDVTLGTVLVTGVFVWGMVVFFGADGICACLNRIKGQVVFESGAVWGKHLTEGKGCHFHIVVESVTVPGGRGLCVTKPDWDRLQYGDRLPIITITGALGQQVGLAPGALDHVEGRTR